MVGILALRRWLVIVLLVGLCASCAILSKGKPHWYDYNDIVMEDYQGKKVVILPVLVEGSQAVDRKHKVGLQKAIRTQMKSIFDMEAEIISEDESGKGKIDQSNEQRELARRAGSDAYVVARVFDIKRSATRSGRDIFYNIGLEIFFNDTVEVNRYWGFSKSYQSDFGFDAHEIDLNYILYRDLREVKRSVSRGLSLFGLGQSRRQNYGEAGKPKLILAAEESRVNEDANGFNAWETNSNQFKLNLSASDLKGISKIEINNASNDYSDGREYVDNLALRQSQVFYVPLESGVNNIVVDAYNRANTKTTKSIKVIRKNEKSTKLMVVSSEFALNRNYYESAHDKLSEFEDLGQKNNNLVYLGQRRARRKDFLITVEGLADEIYHNAFLSPALLFSGAIEVSQNRTGAKQYYLMLHDSQADYLRSTAVNVDYILEVWGDNAIIMIEDCSLEAQQSTQYRLADKSVMINIYPCDRPLGDVSQRILQAYKRMPLDEIVEEEKLRLARLPVYGLK